MFTQRKDIMGVLVNRPFTNVLAWLAAGLIVVLNVYLILQTFTGG
jgi:manganese transport protein